jgi:uncharacterized protein YjbI with pentapeptide repeats
VDADGKPRPEAYDLLANATPEEKADIVLWLIEEHPEGRLELPEMNGLCADLSEVDLSRDTLKAKCTQLNYEPPWWDIESHSTGLWFADLRGANLESANLQCANLQGADFQSADLQGANLQDAKLAGANLQDTILVDTDFRSADLGRTDLQNAILVIACFQSADLRDARLQGVELSLCDITHVYISGAWLDRTRLRREQLGGAIGEELDGKYGEAKQGYLALKQNFDDLGDYDAASWAYRKERRMEKLEARQKARTALPERKWWAAVANYAKFAGDQLVEWMCDYGESIPRVLGFLLVVYVLFTLIYGLTWSVMRVSDTPTALIKEPTRNLVDLARFSLGTMTTMGPVGLEPRNGLVELVAGLEALLGIALTGLLGFVLGNRIRRS